MGWALLLGNPSAWIVPPLFGIGMTHVQIVPEEQALARLFGDECLPIKEASRGGSAALGNRRSPAEPD